MIPDPRLRTALRPVRAALAQSIALGLLAGLLLIAQAYLLSQTVDRVFLGGRTLRQVLPLLSALACAAVLRALALWGGEVAAFQVAAHVKSDLRARLLAHLLALGPAYTRGERSGELATTATTGIEELDAYLSQYLPQLILAALIPLSMLIVVFPLDLLSGIVLLLTAPLIPLFMVLIGKAAAHQSRRQWAQLSRMSAHFLDVLQGLTTLKLFGRSREQTATIAAVSDQFRAATLAVLRVAFLSALALELLATLSTAIIAVQIGLRLLYARLAFDDAFFILILAPDYYGPLRALGARFHAGTTGVTAAARIFAVLETPLPPCGEAQTHALGASQVHPAPHVPASRGAALLRPGLAGRAPAAHRAGNVTCPPALAFTDVTCTYPGADRPALQAVSFHVQAGQTVALIGPSGAGKSTLAHLLLRFLAPEAGTITADGVDLCAIPPAAWRARLAWVPQLPYLFAASVAENIRLGRPEASLQEVMHAAEQAGAEAFIRALPGGYATPIGERGARLSGGQAQRLALARAFLRDAPLLLLDEATANLDPATEAQIVASIRALRQGRTAIIIAHRLQTVIDADLIVVLEGGRVVETGQHADLLAAGGLYARLIAAGEVAP